MDAQGSAQGPAIDTSKGFRLQDLGSDSHMVTDNVSVDASWLQQWRCGDRRASNLLGAYSAGQR
jgi:hypothetical protein